MNICIWGIYVELCNHFHSSITIEIEHYPLRSGDNYSALEWVKVWRLMQQWLTFLRRINVCCIYVTRPQWGMYLIYCFWHSCLQHRNISCSSTVNFWDGGYSNKTVMETDSALIRHVICNTFIWIYTPSHILQIPPDIYICSHNC